MPATIIPVDTRPATWTNANGYACTFRPRGRRGVEGYVPNRTNWSSKETWAARLFVGFNVGHDTKWDMDDLIGVVRRVREAQTGNPSASFLYQRGIYKHAAGDVVEEPGAQVIIINMGESRERFVQQMLDLAEVIAAELEQEEVVVEIQRNGLVQEVIGVGA